MERDPRDEFDLQFWNGNKRLAYAITIQERQLNDSIHRASIQVRDREQLEQYQLDRLNTLLRKVLPYNRYYQDLFGCSQRTIHSMEEWSKMPTSQKSDWLSNDPDGIAVHHTFSQEGYRRYHRTSGTRGKPMVILDTADDWQWWKATWQYVLDASGIHSGDRIMMAFSFGPFIGFWSAHDACLQRECMVIPCGGMSTAARIDLIQSARPTVLFSTPSYAMHMADDAALRGIDLRGSSIRQVFVAGEAGGSVPTVRSKIETAFGAKVMDHAGATEVGPWGFGSKDGHALHVIESEFIAEFLPWHQGSLHGAALFELVLTSLGRVGAPVLRYRTGDLVRPHYPSGGETKFVRLELGVLGRADDMFVVRGVNIFPSSIDAIVRSFPSITDYRLSVTKKGSMDEMRMEFETNNVNDDPIASALAEKLSVQLNLRFDVVQVTGGSLPRSEGKAKRVFDLRENGST